MDSLKETKIPRVTVEYDQQCVIEVTKEGVVIAEVVCYVENINFDIVGKRSSVKLNCFDPYQKGEAEKHHNFK